MNAGKATWARRYQTALRHYLQSGLSASLPSARRLGRQAVTLGIETLDVVRIHERAVEAVPETDNASVGPRVALDRAQVFFAEVLVPIESTHQAAQQADARVRQLTRTLRQRTQEALISRRQLKRSVARRQATEAALMTSGKHRANLLAEARGMQVRLRNLTREMMESHEEERRKTSRHLYDELAQSLLAINLKLLMLQGTTKANTLILKKEIAETQRLVIKSSHTIRGLSHACERDHET